ncbi:hypothetical protein SVAN01_02612, partial [Stagonosporopsis vannaccii]
MFRWRSAGGLANTGTAADKDGAAVARRVCGNGNEACMHRRSYALDVQRRAATPTAEHGSSQAAQQARLACVKTSSSHAWQVSRRRAVTPAPHRFTHRAEDVQSSAETQCAELATWTASGRAVVDADARTPRGLGGSGSRRVGGRPSTGGPAGLGRVLVSMMRPAPTIEHPTPTVDYRGAPAAGMASRTSTPRTRSPSTSSDSSDTAMLDAPTHVALTPARPRQPSLTHSAPAPTPAAPS